MKIEHLIIPIAFCSNDKVLFKMHYVLKYKNFHRTKCISTIFQNKGSLIVSCSFLKFINTCTIVYVMTDLCCVSSVSYARLLCRSSFWQFRETECDGCVWRCREGESGESRMQPLTNSKSNSLNAFLDSGSAFIRLTPFLAFSGDFLFLF